MGKRSRGPRGPRGFTLIELMIALLVSSLLVGMILAIFSRMSLAYRGQQQIAGVQQVLTAARAAIELDAKQAGLAMAQGFTAAPTGTTPQYPVQVADSSTGPDRVAFFYADPATQALVKTGDWTGTTLTVDSVDGFNPGDLIVLSTVDAMQASPYSNEAKITQYHACVVQIAVGGVTTGPPQIAIADASAVPWGGSAHCGPAPTTLIMVYKLVAHAYQIDPARPALGVLQQSPTGGLLGKDEVWNDLAYGFTDLQTALRVVLPPPPGLPGTDPDADGDGYRDWYSGTNQEGINAVPPVAPMPDTAVLQQMTISLVARTDRDVEGIATANTPNLTRGSADNNDLGDHASVPLPSTTDLALQGSRIYRYVTFQVDLRNLGVGR